MLTLIEIGHSFISVEKTDFQCRRKPVGLRICDLAPLAHGLGSEPGPGFHVRRVVLCHQILQTIPKYEYVCRASFSAG